MRRLFIIVFMLFFSRIVFATEQIPEYLQYGKDTVPIYSNPLEQYFRINNDVFIPGFNSECLSSACWRGYIAYWELTKDSLFLTNITPCVPNCENNQNGNLDKMFGEEKPYAEWYSGTLIVPRGEFHSASHMGYSAIYEYEEHIQIENGKKVQKVIKSNAQLIADINQNKMFNERIETASDTFLYHIKHSLSNRRAEWCSLNYILYYNKDGRLKAVRPNGYEVDSEKFSDKVVDYLMNRCASRIKKVLQPLLLSYINPVNDFMIEIELWSGEELEMKKCQRFYNISENDIKEWIKEQMNTE